jgi:hypothetical protein
MYNESLGPLHDKIIVYYILNYSNDLTEYLIFRIIKIRFEITPIAFPQIIMKSSIIIP